MAFKNTLRARHLQIVQGIIFGIFILKAFYLLHFTAYQSSVQYDMASYWYGAYERAWGDKFEFHQYGVAPPFYIYLCAYFLHAMSSLGMLSYALPLLIVLNVLLQSVSSYFVYLMADRLTGRKVFAFGALFFYTLSYLQLYLNALVFPENLATPLLIIVIWIIVFRPLSLSSMLIAGLLLGIAVASKPLFAVLSPAVIGCVWLRLDKKGKLPGIFVLSMALVAVPLATVMENYHISQGKVLSVSPTGGANFFQGWGQISKITSETSYGTWWLYSPGSLDEVYWRPIDTHEPWFHQGYYYRLGWEAIHNDPGVILKKIFWFKKLFWGILGPTLNKAPAGYYKIMPALGWLYYMMFLTPWILLLPAFRRVCDKAIYFLFSILSIVFLSIYLCGMPEKRYFSYVEFLVVILFFVALDKIIGLWRVYKKEILAYFFCLLYFFFFIPLICSKWMGINGVGIWQG